jgi:hypothetical protein
VSQPLPQPATEPPGLTAGQLVDLVAIVMAYRAATGAIRDQLGGIVRGLWLSLGQYRDRQRRQFAGDVIPYVQAAAAQMSSLTAGYLAAIQQQHTGRLVTPPAVRPPDLAALRNGADPAEVYGRPFDLVWRQLAELPHVDGAIEQAIGAGMNRAEKTAFTDLQLAKRQSSQESLRSDRYAIGYRRVLEGAHSCGLCIVASTNRYHKGQLLPIHPGCDCGVVPVYVDSDAAAKANQRLLGDVHQAIADRFGVSDYAARTIPGAKDGKGRPIDYKDVLITHEHGELGPVLAVKGRPFTGPADLNVTRRTRKRPAKAGRTPEQIRAELGALERSLPGLTSDRQRTYTEQRVARLREQLG